MKVLFIFIIFSFFTPHAFGQEINITRPFGGFVALSPVPNSVCDSPINSPFVIRVSGGIFGPYATPLSFAGKTLRPGTPVLGRYQVKPMETCVVSQPAPIPVKPFVVGPAPAFQITTFGIGQ